MPSRSRTIRLFEHILSRRAGHDDTSGVQDQQPCQTGFCRGNVAGSGDIAADRRRDLLFQGIAAVASDDLLVIGVEYTYQFDTTAWGWIHIVLGVVLVISAIGLMTGATWARVVAVCIAALSILANFLWLPYYPLWSILIIALDVVVIWAVTTWDTARD